ncbi:GNAT family N-acetyltransferase [Halomicrobium salinisoli]|uniref:GNAT family N-acetyltransferase n=1 Tax=Halomicrobium salinisoli TaxID=2878391 RepID=UPI001CF05989|nr:GNAT family N-acetyltransferase [Halomicrobium salinisoli]
MLTTTPALTVRHVRPGDGPAVRGLNERAMAETPEWVPDAPDADLERLPDSYADGEFLVGTVGGEIVAMGAYVPLGRGEHAGWMADEFDVDGRAAEITRMRVDPDRQRRGHGRRIYRTLERRAAGDGYRTLVLNTGAENERARAFYEDLGFDSEDEVTVEFADATLDLALYRKRIDERS